MTVARTGLQPAAAQQFTAYDLEARAEGDEHLPLFLELSAALTGFSEAELLATGNVRHLFEELGVTVGVGPRAAFLQIGLPPQKLLLHAIYGPLAKNVLRMWYLGRWQRLPDNVMTALRTTFSEVDAFGRNFERVISARAYREGLVWPAVGAHPPAAKPPGFASWAEPPR